MFGFLAGFLSGAATGIYLSQNYEVPNMKELLSVFKETTKKYEKKDKKET